MAMDCDADTAQDLASAPPPPNAEQCILTDVKGTCLWFDRKKGYGFLEMDRDENVVKTMPLPTPNVFAHQSEIQMDGFRYLRPSRRVVCNVLQGGDNRYRAVKIREMAC